MLHLDSKLDLDKTRNEIEQTQIRLDTLVNLEDSSLSIMEDFKYQIEQINQILANLYCISTGMLDLITKHSIARSLKSFQNDC